jgi:hypothetical protein
MELSWLVLVHGPDRKPELVRSAAGGRFARVGVFTVPRQHRESEALKLPVNATTSRQCSGDCRARYTELQALSCKARDSGGIA